MPTIKGETEAATPSRFYQELKIQLDGYNERHGRTVSARGIPYGPGVQLTMRRLVSDALDVSAADAVLTKIRKGIYTPSNEKIELLAKKLRINPDTFTDYVVRDIQQKYLSDPGIVNLFRRLAAQSKPNRKRLIQELQEVVEKAS